MKFLAQGFEAATRAWARTNSIGTSATAIISLAIILSSAASAQPAWNANGSVMYINPSTTNVGIGTTAPSFTLDVTSPSAATTARFQSGVSISTLLVRDTTGVGLEVTGSSAYGHQLFGEGVYPLLLGVNGAESMRIQYNGNVGIATKTPDDALTLSPNMSTTYGLDIIPSVVPGSSTGSMGIHLKHPNGAMLGYLTYGYATGTNYPDMFLWNSQVGALRLGTSNAEHLTILSTGNVGIGTTNPTNTLSVNGIIQAKEVLVNTGWSDYVFEPAYRLQPLSEVADYVRAEHHLPGIPSAAEVADKGISVGEMESKLLAKIEELTLHLIAAEERINKLEAGNR